MRKSIIAASALAALLVAGTASATGNGPRGGSIVIGGNNASAWAGTGSVSRASGNGIATNSGVAIRHSSSTLNLHRSPSLVGASGTAATSGLTTNHSLALGNAATHGGAHSSGDANFWARGGMSGTRYAYDGTRASFDGGMVVRGGVSGESSTNSGAIFRGRSGGFATDGSAVEGSAVADFDFNRYTGADLKRAEVETAQGTFAETGSYRYGLAGVNTDAVSRARVGGDAWVNARLVNVGACRYRCN